MSKQDVYSVCGMCTVRCPIKVEVENGEVVFLTGNPHIRGIEGSICARGIAGKALIEDRERNQSPMIRKGKRGEGLWEKVSWDTALDYTAEKMKGIIDKYGPESVLLTDRGGPFRDLHRAFLRGLGSPNYVNHDGTCARNVQHAALSLFGFGRKDVTYDLANAKHVVLQTRNLFEAIDVKEVGLLTGAMEEGCRLTVIDIRASVSATKADDFFLIRPGTDYAFNLAIIRELIAEDLYDAGFTGRWIKDFDKLRDFVQPYTPEWAEAETGIAARRIRRFARGLSAAKPSVIWHPGWMNARYLDSFYMSRSVYIINALLGSVGAEGGLAITNKPADFGRKGLKKFMDLYEKPEQKRADGAGWRYPHFESGPGVTQLAFKAIQTEDPYPLKAYLCYRHDPFMGCPDPENLKTVFNKLDLLVSITFTWSDTAWFADVVLPLSPYLERESIIATKNDLIPYFFIRGRAVEPRFDTRSDWEIVSGLARRLNLPQVAFDRVEDIWNFQLEGTGVDISDFDETGVVMLGDAPKYHDVESLKFKTKSGKIEIINETWEDQGLASLKPYRSPEFPPEGSFRLTFGRCGVHTQGHTVNNPVLFEQMPENDLWIHTDRAAALNIADKERVLVERNGYTETVRANVTDLIHPDSVFVVHGFGHTLPVESRALGKGMADNKFMMGGFDIWDPAGGAIAYQVHFVNVRKM